MQIRLSREEIDALVKMGFIYAVVIYRDVSVRVPGAVDSVFHRVGDARREVVRLCNIYDRFIEEGDSHVLLDLRSATPMEGE